VILNGARRSRKELTERRLSREKVVRSLGEKTITVELIEKIKNGLIVISIRR
jgi:hypothetical protein